MELVGFGRKQQPQGYRNRIRNYSQLLVIAVLEGRLRVQSEGLDRSLGPRALLVLPPGASFTLATARRGYRGHYTEGNPATAGLPARLQLLTLDEPLTRTLLDIESELAEPSEPSLVAEFYRVLHVRALRRARLAAGSHRDALVDHVDRLLFAHRQTCEPLESILAGLGRSPRQLRRLYRAERGVTIKRAHLLHKLEEARKLLQDSSLTVSAIAAELGFPSSQHFATQFRRYFGQTPSSLRAVRRFRPSP